MFSKTSKFSVNLFILHDTLKSIYRKTILPLFYNNKSELPENRQIPRLSGSPDLLYIHIDILVRDGNEDRFFIKIIDYFYFAWIIDPRGLNQSFILCIDLTHLYFFLHWFQKEVISYAFISRKDLVVYRDDTMNGLLGVVT